MQLRSKLLFGLVATVLMVGMMASTAEAQIQITLFPNGASTEVASSRTALTTDRSSTGSGVVITGGLLAQSNLTSTNLVLTYSAPITSSADNNPSPGANPAGDALRLAGATGVFATSTITTINFAAGTVTISMPTFAVNTASGSMRLVGVRVDASAETAPVTVTGSLSNTANNYLLSSSAAQTVLSTLTAGIGSAAIGVVTGNVGSGTSTLLTNATIADATAQILITEGFASAWRTATQESNSGTALGGSGSQITLTFSGIPAGVTLTGAVTNSSSSFTAPTIGTNNTATSAAGDNVFTFTLPAAGGSLTTVNSFDVTVTVTVSGTTTSLTAATITAVADLAPIAAAYSTASGSGGFPTSTAYPRFAAAATDAFTVVSIIAARTNLLVPYLVAGGGFDTGIVIANTTADPWSGIGGGTPLGGTLTYHFYPRTSTGAGTLFSLTTGSTVTPGVGLSTTGVLDAGATHSVLLSELLIAASQSADFTGYVFVEANFLLAHGISFVSDFTGPFTSFSPMLVIPNTQTTARTANESLGF